MVAKMFSNVLIFILNASFVLSTALQSNGVDVTPKPGNGTNGHLGITITWDTSLKMEVGDTKNLTFTASMPVKCVVNLTLDTTHVHAQGGNSTPVNMTSLVVFQPKDVNIEIPVSGLLVGQIVMQVNKSAPCNVTINPHDRIEVYIVHSSVIVIISEIIGWIYFVAWSISFYPQVWLNFRRKSVIGLNFDFLALNITGFLAYAIYNVGLFWITTVQNQYFEKHPDGVNPVQINDVIFALHAVLMTAILIVQSFIYESGGQKISKIAWAILVVIWVGIFILLFIAVGKKITWLTYLNIFSYVKLGITLIKYIPQAFMNYRRKSTEGWSIGNVLLDFVGGFLSILQMILQSYNNDEWDLVFGDPTKFGLGLFSILFDILFMVQHYILYPPSKRKHIESDPLINADEDDE